jgi:hypothetical protein
MEAPMGKLNRKTSIASIAAEQATAPPVRKLNRQPVEKPNPDNYWELITVCGREFCFVCEGKLGDRPKKFIGLHKITEEELHRHEMCEPGSANWFKKFGGYVSKSMRGIVLKP